MAAAWGVFDTIYGAAAARLDDAGALTHLTFRFDTGGFDAPRNDAALAFVARQIAAYGEGELRNFDLPLAPRGGGFHQQVWAALLDIPFGETRSYGDIAHAVGNPGAARAVGRANGANPIALIIPCHRVIGADGTLTGYAGGLDLKSAMLTFERDQASAQLSLFA